MRFRSLGFRRFGAFDERVLTFPDSDRSLHVVYGPNEAGKSTALEGLSYFLFGFPQRATYAFRYPPAEQRIFAELVDRAGAALAVMRRRSTKTPFRSLDDATSLPDDCLKPYLGELDREQFEMLFGIDHGQLVEGGQSMAKGEGNLGQTLFAAGAGVAGLSRIQSDLDERLEELYLPRGQREINTLLSRLTEEHNRLRERTVAVEEFLQEHSRLTLAGDRMAQLEQELSRLRDDEARLTSYRHAQPTIQMLARLDEELSRLRDAPRLPDDFAETYRATFEEHQSARAVRERRREDLERIASLLAAAPESPAVLAEAGEIAGVQEAFAVVRNSQQSRDSLVGERRRCDEVLRETTGATAGDMKTSDDVPAIGADEAQRIRALGEAGAVLTHQVDSLRKQIAETDARLAELRQKLGPTTTTTTSSLDVGDIEPLLRDALRDCQAEAVFEQKKEEFRKSRAMAEQELASLKPCWDGPLRAVARLRPLGLDAVAEYERQVKEVDRSIASVEARRSLHEGAAAERTRELQVLEKSAGAPREADLAEARRQRDQAIDAFLEDPSPLQAAAVRNLVRHCDDLVDGMARTSDRAAKLARCREELKKAREILDGDGTILAGFRAQRSAILERWRSDWQPTGIDPAEPETMRNWLADWSKLRERVGKLEESARDIKSAAADIDAVKDRLRAALGLGDADREATLKSLYERLRIAVDLAQARARSRAEHESQLKGTLERRDALAADLRAAEDSRSAWRADWSRALRGIGVFDADPEPASVHRRLDLHAEIVRCRKEAQAIDARLTAIDLERGEFVRRLTALCQRLGEPSPADDALEAVVERLTRSADEARAQLRERQRLESEQSTATQALADAERSAVAAWAKLQSLGEQAGFAQVDELPELIRRSNERRQREAERAQEREKLRHHAQVEDVDAFLEAASTAIADLDDRLAANRRRQAEIQQEIPDAAVAASNAERQIESWRQNSSQAAESQQAIESLLAEISDQVMEYASIHLARATLRRTVERFRERRHGSLLASAEEFFRTLTLGAFRGLDVEESDDDPRLVALRTSPEERVEISALSDGTRDQLFLAVRLAGIEHHIAVHGPMPVVVDDVLVNFDEDRAAATLRCLADLSRRTQVLLFTHHFHVADLARQVAEADVCCHDLSRKG